MDPLSITASIITVLTTAIQVKQKLEKFSGLLRHAPEHVSALLDEVETLQNFLREIKSIVEQHRMISHIRASDDLLQNLNRAVLREGRLVQQLDELIHYRLLRPGSGAVENDIDVVRRAWIKEQNNLAQMQRAIREGCQDITMILNTLNT